MYKLSLVMCVKKRFSMFAFGVCVLAIATLFGACKKTEVHQFQKPYKGPLLVVSNINALVSDSGKPQILMRAPQQLEYESGNRYFPNGIKIDFYDQDTTKKPSQLTAKKGKYNKIKNEYVVTDNVVIQNYIENKKLETEELHWDPVNHKIYTDKFVKIQTPEELLTGTGLVSNEDFSSYRILKVAGIFPLQ